MCEYDEQSVERVVLILSFCPLRSGYNTHTVTLLPYTKLLFLEAAKNTDLNICYCTPMETLDKPAWKLANSKLMSQSALFQAVGDLSKDPRDAVLAVNKHAKSFLTRFFK